jgi:hypothetical protein
MARTLSEEAARRVRDLAEKAAPHRLTIMDELTKKIRFLRQSFVLHFVKDINKKKDKEHYVATKIEQEKIFRKVKDYIHYEGQASPNKAYDGLNKLEKILDEVQIAVQYLRYIGHTENLDKLLADRNMTITCRALEATNEVLTDEEVQDNIIKIFDAANKAQDQICAEVATIKEDIYDELEESIKYDAKHNKSGLKSNEFDKLTTLEAIRQKSEDAAEKKLDSMKDSIGNTIDSQLNVQAVAQTIAG